METEIRTAVGLEKGIEIGVVQEKVPNPKVEINPIGIRVEMIIGDKVEILLETDLNQGQDQVPSVSTNRDRHVGATDAMNMITLQGKCPHEVTGGSSDDTGGSLLRMLDPDETYALYYADGEDYDMDLNM